MYRCTAVRKYSVQCTVYRPCELPPVEVPLEEIIRTGPLRRRGGGGVKGGEVEGEGGGEGEGE